MTRLKRYLYRNWASYVAIFGICIACHPLRWWQAVVVGVCTSVVEIWADHLGRQQSKA